MGRQHGAGWGGVVLGLWLATGVPASAFTAYVSNEKGNSVSVIDTTTMAVTATWKVGRRPRGVTLSKDGKELFVCASDDDRIDVLDTATGKVVRSLRSGPDPEQFILNASGNPLYVANEDDSQVTIIDIEKNKVLAEVPVGVEPEGMGLSPDGSILVNTSETTNMAHFIADGKYLWVSAEVGGTVSVIDVATRRVVKKITFKIPSVNDEAIQPVGIRITKDGTKAFVALGPANRVAVIDAKTYEVQKYLPVGQRVWQLAFTPDQKQLFTTNGTSNDVSVIDVEAEKVVKSISVGLLPWGVAISPN